MKKGEWTASSPSTPKTETAERTRAGTRKEPSRDATHIRHAADQQLTLTNTRSRLPRARDAVWDTRLKRPAAPQPLSARKPPLPPDTFQAAHAGASRASEPNLKKSHQ